MVKIIKVKAILDFSKNDYIIKNKVLVFDEKILKITSLDEALNEYKNAKLIDCSGYVLSPVFCNIHSHLEFCTSKLDYGDFALWLESIIKNRDDISKNELNNAINDNLNTMLKSGVGYLGEISSFGANLQALSKSPIKSIVFHELLGANSDVAYKNIEFFNERFHRFSKLNNAISLHSPYSICDETYDYAINFAKQNDLIISTHFQESKYESEHLAHKQNALSKYLSRFNPSVISRDFLKGFDELKAIFTHCNYVDDFSVFKLNHVITTCPRSNRYLGSKRFNLSKALEHNIKLSIATDGLSSNDSLNYFDELRSFIMLYPEYDLNELSYIAYKSSVYDNSAMFLDGYTPLSINASADFMLLDDFSYSDEQMLSQIILRTKEIKNMYLNGELII